MSVSARSEAAPAPPSDGRQSAAARSREATRSRLLTSGIQLFSAHGLNGVTTHDIAREAGVASGTFYLHFSDKNALFHEIAVDTEARLRAHIESATTQAADLRGAVENRDLFRILFSAESGVAGSELLDSFAGTIAEGRRHAIATGEMPREIDAAVLSQALVGLLSRVVLWWLEEPQPVTRETVIETLTRIQLSGTHPA
jgi:AcrR family transcriptional regulator